MSNNSSKTFVAMTAVLGFAGAALADTVMNHDPGTYKMTKFGSSGDTIPLNGPVIRVFSRNGKNYDAIANDNENLKHSSQVGGICGRRAQKFSSASVKVADRSHSVSGTGNHSLSRHTETFEFPFTLPDIPRAPAAACNFELDKRVAQGNKSRNYWMSQGFVVKYENAYEATFSASCSGGIARGDFESKTIRTPVWIACAATDTQADSKPDTPARMPASRARPVALKVRATLEATKQGTIYASECPATVRYTGSIWVSKPGTRVTYQILGSDWDSPKRNLTFKKAGSQEITGWTQYYREQKADRDRISAAPAGGRKQPDASGSAKLVVNFDGGTVQSEVIPYKVYCNADQPKRVLSIKTE